LIDVMNKKFPNGNWIIKFDATDVKVSLQESIRGKWNGDVDLGDGRLQELRLSYDQLRDFVMKCDFESLMPHLLEHEDWLSKELQTAEDQLQKKKQTKGINQDTLDKLGWKVSFCLYLK